MKIRQGFTLIEIIVSLLIVAVLVAVGAMSWRWYSNSIHEYSYGRVIEDMVLRAVDYAKTLEKPVAICFRLSDECVAEGVLVHDLGTSETSANWSLLEAFPQASGMFTRTNFKEDRLSIKQGGQSVDQPGTIAICNMDSAQNEEWGVVVARSARVTLKKLDGDAASMCSNR